MLFVGPPSPFYPGLDTVYPDSIVEGIFTAVLSDIENTEDWLGCPTPLETCRHQLALYENEFEELNLQLRQAREQIFKLVEMHAEAVRQRDEHMATLREKAAETATIRRQIYHLDISERGAKREVERLRQMLDGMTPQPKTIL